MTASIFIKTCRKDLPWFKLCIDSIDKYCAGFDEVVIVADESCRGHITSQIGDIAYAEDWPNGYIQQQAVKLNADTYVTSDNILFVDSDCVFFAPCTPESFMREGKPVLLKTHYSRLEGSGATAWREITKKFTGYDVEWEYMRRIPCMYRSSTFSKFREAIPDLIDRLRSVTDKSFSEFNAIGAFIDRFDSDDYYISDTDVWMHDPVAKQFWSWGGLNKEISREIQSFLE